MKLPNGNQATIDPRKVTDYCLSPDHEDGQHKAHLFSTMLGLTLDNADLLLDALRIAPQPARQRSANWTNMANGTSSTLSSPGR